MPILNLMSPSQQHKLRKLMQYHPTTAGGMMSPDYVSVVTGTSAAAAIEAVRTDDKAPHQLLNTIFVTEADGKFVGSVSLADLVRADQAQKVEQLELTDCRIWPSADFADVTLMMADYNLTALAVTERTGILIGAISVDDLLEALVPEEWRNRVEASTGV
jgi:Mg/Co/Ni transporter MgtE